MKCANMKSVLNVDKEDMMFLNARLQKADESYWTVV